MMGARMERDMRQQLFDHYEQLSFSYYDQHNSGQMMSKLVSDLFDISEFAHHGPENLFISIVKIVGSFVFLFLINWRLAIPLAILVVCMFFFSLKQNRRMQQTFLENRRKIGDVNEMCIRDSGTPSASIIICAVFGCAPLISLFSIVKSIPSSFAISKLCGIRISSGSIPRSPAIKALSVP